VPERKTTGAAQDSRGIFREKRSRVAERKGNAAFCFREVRMRRHRDKKTLTLSETFTNRDLVKAQLYPDCGFLWYRKIKPSDTTAKIAKRLLP